MDKEYFLKSKQDIENWLLKNEIKNYEIIQDEKYLYIVNVNGDVILYNKNLKNIPIKFGIINGDFDCSMNFLSSLEFAPQKAKSFYCYSNELEDLKDCPEVLLNFCCQNNNIKSLVGVQKQINGVFFCENNKLKNLNGCPEYIQEEFNISNNKIDSLEYFPKKVYGNFCSFGNNLAILDEDDFNSALNAHIEAKIKKRKELLEFKIKNESNSIEKNIINKI